MVVASVAVLVVLNSDAVAGNMGTVSARGGWAVAWSDNFDGPVNSSVNQEYWEFDTGQGIFGTKEIERVTASTANVRLDGHGDLDLVARGHGAGGTPGMAWTSGRIQTKRFFTPPPGGEMMVTVSIEQPDPANGLGYWPACWMLGADPSTWPADGEIDILEDINGLSEHSGILHCGNMWQRNPDGTSDVVCRCDTPAVGTTSGGEMVVRDVAVYTRQDAPAAP